MHATLIVALLVACGPDVQADVGGDWYGSFAHEGPEPWAVRLFDLQYEGVLDPATTTNPNVTGAWQTWEGTFEMWGSTDVEAVQSWFNDPVGIPIDDLVGDAFLWVCEDEVGCTNGADVYAPHGYLLTAWTERAVMVNAGSFDEGELAPMWGQAWWTNDVEQVLTGRVALAPAYAGLALGDPP